MAPDLVDPFTGEALIYRPAANGFVLYGIGANLVDDNGAADDIVWRYFGE